MCIVDVMAGNERGVIVAREALGSGAARVEVERTLVYTVRDGRLGACWLHDQDQALIEQLVGP